MINIDICFKRKTSILGRLSYILFYISMLLKNFNINISTRVIRFLFDNSHDIKLEQDLKGGDKNV
ncbi:hypothetical protein BN424_2142 [Carnobacterium maltaromaticum LMA28]|uniref:Uncharacterized protein n=1 Tax=Carnobacterium maltaromaticum LMA28 TaxID=1234679 RepID=K8E4R9_CARML|nr:hypothetical protein [Carnobacterium maltaromaticum]CCO11582.2 hypothetical protein BN424_2142 [Carnobacterium maltaromaticum LMA28]